MANEAKLNEEVSPAQGALKERTAVPLEAGLPLLAKYGSYDLVETIIEGAANINPEKKARKKIFLTEADKKKERQQLKKRLELWSELLSSADSVPEMIEIGQKQADTAFASLKENLGKAMEQLRPLEQSYRSVAMFFKNTEQEKVKNVTFLNATPDQLQDLDVTTFIDAVGEELAAKFDRLDLRENYSILNVPGYLGSGKVVDKWAKMAHKNKAMLLTDFMHLDAPEDVMELFESANLTGGAAHLSNVMMTCNWLVGRAKHDDLGEEEDLYIPPSTALAGNVYKTLMSQVAAGKKHGTLSEVDGVRFPLKKSEIADLEKMGLIPMVNEYSKVMAFSAKTLFNGDNVGLQTYSVVRVFDYITKVLIDFLNRRAFENFDYNTKNDLKKQIIKFLDSVTGPGKLIEKFSVMRFEQDKNQKDKVYLDIHMVPYFPAKNFMIALTGQKGDDLDAAEWAAEYAQQ
ncbi:DUF5458 family protein [Dyadobacter pollutisoli]|uniref:DUF5458 family protein n=1 Tax=Dyadobacter pollutisoli TaxID=2910158 RepID=A0A9E8N6I7_9BACT|nr:DUF5458 family protein [Dyadobacter pollutisoli]WAC10759.1 DUF5458 family protein [Dyadobacter pollutisoli]